MYAQWRVPCALANCSTSMFSSHTWTLERGNDATKYSDLAAGSSFDLKFLIYKMRQRTDIILRVSIHISWW